MLHQLIGAFCCGTKKVVAHQVSCNYKHRMFLHWKYTFGSMYQLCLFFFFSFFFFSFMLFCCYKYFINISQVVEVWRHLLIE